MSRFNKSPGAAAGKCSYDWEKDQGERLVCVKHKTHPGVIVLSSRRRSVLLELLNLEMLQGLALIEAIKVAREEDPLEGI